MYNILFPKVNPCTTFKLCFFLQFFSVFLVRVVTCFYTFFFILLHCVYQMKFTDRKETLFCHEKFTKLTIFQKVQNIFTFYYSELLIKKLNFYDSKNFVLSVTHFYCYTLNCLNIRNVYQIM